MNKIKKLIAGVTALFLAGTVSAYAALPAVVGSTITGIQTDALAIVDLIWPVVGALLGAFIALKVFKRVANKV